MKIKPKQATYEKQLEIITNIDGIESLLTTIDEDTSVLAAVDYATSAKQDTIIGHIDGVEGLLTTIDADTSTLAAVDFATSAKQDDIISDTGAIQTATEACQTALELIDDWDYATSAKQDTIIGHVDGIEGLLTTIDADTGSILDNQTNNSQTGKIVGIDYVAGNSGIDASTETLQTIDYSHHEIHSGNHYKAGYMDASMATNDTVEVLFVTPDTTEWAHWTLTSQSTGAVKVEVYEDTIASSNGTAVTRWNRNRNSSNASSTLVFHTPTVTTDGTKMVTRYLGSEGFKEDISGEHRGDSEFVLKQNTKYLIRLTAISDGIIGAIGGDWYEHTDKN